MTRDQLQKELYQLMVGSISIQSLGAEERTQLQNQILILPEPQMRNIIKILNHYIITLLGPIFEIHHKKQTLN